MSIFFCSPLICSEKSSNLLCSGVSKIFGHWSPLPERITQKDKELANDLNYDVIEFPVWEKFFSKIEAKKNICINVFCYENKLIFPIYISDQKFENSIDLLLMINENK